MAPIYYLALHPSQPPYTHLALGCCLHTYLLPHTSLPSHYPKPKVIISLRIPLFALSPGRLPTPDLVRYSTCDFLLQLVIESARPAASSRPLATHAARFPLDHSLSTIWYPFLFPYSTSRLRSITY